MRTQEGGALASSSFVFGVEFRFSLLGNAGDLRWRLGGRAVTAMHEEAVAVNQVLQWVLAVAKTSGKAVRGSRAVSENSSATTKRGAKGNTKKNASAAAKKPAVSVREKQDKCGSQASATACAKTEQSEESDGPWVKDLGKCLSDCLHKRFSNIVDHVLKTAETNVSAAKVVFGFEMVKDELKPVRRGRRRCEPSLAKILQDELAARVATASVQPATEPVASERDS